MPEVRLLTPTAVRDILTNAGLAPTRRAVRRLAQQGGIKLNGAAVTDPLFMAAPDAEHVLQIGRRKFVRLVA